MLTSDSSQFPKRFQAECLSMINNIVELTSSVFSLVSPTMKFNGIVTSNLDLEQQTSYENKYIELDPLNPQKFTARSDIVVCADSVSPGGSVVHTAFFREFLQPLNYRYVADMFFRQNGKIVAVLSLLRARDLGRFEESELDLLRKIQPFLEYTLNAVYIPRRVAERCMIRDTYGLTERELDVTELVLTGVSNKTIANELGLKTATVKTHLHNIFKKAHVQSRAQLMSNVVNGINSFEQTDAERCLS